MGKNFSKNETGGVDVEKPTGRPRKTFKQEDKEMMENDRKLKSKDITHDFNKRGVNVSAATVRRRLI